MTVSSRQQYFLQEIGIPIWQSRTAKIQKPAEDISLNLAFNTVVVVADTDLSIESKRLLNAILKSASLAIEQVDLISSSTLQSLDAAILSGKSVLLMDENTHLSTKSDYIQLPSLNVLMSQPELKRNVWQTLKAL